jgi:hypothetical protein
VGEHHVHVVLGEQHGDARLAGDRRRQLHQRHPLGGGHARGRLVHQQEARLVGQRHRQLHALEVAIGQDAAGRAAWPAMPTRSSSAMAGAGSSRGPGSTGRRCGGVAEQRHLHVLQHRHAAEGRGDLEGAPHPSRQMRRGAIR